jgi:DNA-binding response OmpR family regulator
MQAKILVYGNDPILLMTRRLVLEKAGFRVFTTLEFSDAMQLIMHQEIALLILCQSLWVDERQGILATVRGIQSKMKILVIEADEPVSIVQPHEEIVTAPSGPEVLLAAIDRMLGITSSDPSGIIANA